MTAGVVVPPELPARWTHPDRGDGGSGDGGRKSGVGGGSSTGRDNGIIMPMAIAVAVAVLVGRRWWT
jgi:hypothetical protein